MAEEEIQEKQKQVQDENKEVDNSTNESVDENGNAVVDIPEGRFVFGQPKLKHRVLIGKIIGAVQTSDKGQKVAQQIADGRKITLEEASKIPEDELTDEEKELLGESLNMESISGVMTEAIFVTLREAPFEFKTVADIDDEMNYSTGLRLVRYAMEQIRDSILGATQRKN